MLAVVSYDLLNLALSFLALNCESLLELFQWAQKSKIQMCSKWYNLYLFSANKTYTVNIFDAALINKIELISITEFKVAF